MNDMLRNELLLELEKISANLKEQGKADTASFFVIQLELLKSKNGKDIYQALSELSTCRAISQYAGLTFHDENILHRIVCLSIELKQKSF